MIEIASISGIYEHTAGLELMDQLQNVYPEGRIRHYFEMRLPSTDARIQEVLRILAESGWIPTRPDKRWDQSREYLFRLHREYDSSDFASCDLLELRIPSKDWVEDAWRNKDGRIELPGPLKKRLDFRKCNFSWYVVPERAKRILEASDLKRIVFHETIATTKSNGERLQLPNWSYFGNPWWELDSDFTMPPLSPKMQFENREGKPVNHGDYSNGFHRKDGQYSHPEFHYRESDLEGLDQFDLARTAEPFGNRQGYDPFDRPLIVSKRFYDFCVANNLKADWVPVRVDPD